MDVSGDPRFHHEWDALAVGWALTALDASDRAHFAEHMPRCEQCASIIRESLHTVVDLAYGVPDEPPPATLKARILAALTDRT